MLDKYTCTQLGAVSNLSSLLSRSLITCELIKNLCDGKKYIYIACTHACMLSPVVSSFGGVRLFDMCIVYAKQYIYIYTYTQISSFPLCVHAKDVVCPIYLFA